MHDGDLHLLLSYFEESQALYSVVAFVHETSAARAFTPRPRIVCIFSSVQDLETYVKENRKKDAERVLRGMKKWEYEGLEEGLRKMGLLRSEGSEVGEEHERVAGTVTEGDSETKTAAEEKE